MKPAILLLSCFTLLVTVGCESESEPNPYDVIVDSAVSVRLNEHRAKLSARNDSILNAMEKARADSLAHTTSSKVTTVRDSVSKKSIP